MIWGLVTGTLEVRKYKLFMMTVKAETSLKIERKITCHGNFKDTLLLSTILK
jgi:hypothetical protein